VVPPFFTALQTSHNAAGSLFAYNGTIPAPVFYPDAAPGRIQQFLMPIRTTHWLSENKNLLTATVLRFFLFMI